MTANPLGSELFELVPLVLVLGGRDLTLRRESTLGETISSMPGVSSTYFGPNSSRPVIRGLDADRIRILENGVGMLDASSLSNDHAVAADPLVVDRIEVVRGPAALLYGGSAVGGVVNLLDNRIPKARLSGVSGRVEPRYGGPDDERSGAAVLEAGNGRFALHADIYARRTDDLRIPAFARSSRQRALDDPDRVQPTGTLPNSTAKSEGGALGGSLTWDKGYLGLSYSGHNSNYGTVAEPDVKIDLKSDRLDFGGEARDLQGLIQSVKFKFGHTDYKHNELDAGVIATTFESKGYDTRIEATHRKLGPFNGAFGLQLTNFDFSALGAEAFVPSTKTDSKALFLYEEAPFGNFKLTLGGRAERAKVRSQGGGPEDPATGLPRFDPSQERSFTTRSGAMGGLYSFTRDVVLALNLSHTERAPTYYELFANGPHAATGAFEVGSTTLAKERSNAIDLALRVRSGPHSGSVGVYHTRFKNFVGVFGTGNARGADGELNPVDADGDGVADASGEEILPEFQFRAVPAVFRGMEGQGRVRVLDKVGTLDLDLRADYVRATNRDTNEPLPRIPPMRFGFGFDYRFERFGARLDVLHARRQNRVAANELPTDSYTLVTAYLTYRIPVGPTNWEAFLKANNLFDREARNHVSFLKDIAPLPGRGVLVGVRGTF